MYVRAYVSSEMKFKQDSRNAKGKRRRALDSTRERSTFEQLRSLYGEEKFLHNLSTRLVESFILSIHTITHRIVVVVVVVVVVPSSRSHRCLSSGEWRDDGRKMRAHRRQRGERSVCTHTPGLSSRAHTHARARAREYL